MFLLPNHIPIINYILHILDDTSHYMSNSVEHIIMVNEMLREQEEVRVEENVYNSLENIYVCYGDKLKKLEEIERSSINGGEDAKFIMNLSTMTLELLQNISSLQIHLIGLLGELEQADFKSLFLLMINHITIEERYSLEVQSKHINGMQAFGFF